MTIVDRVNVTSDMKFYNFLPMLIGFYYVMLTLFKRSLSFTEDEAVYTWSRHFWNVETKMFTSFAVFTLHTHLRVSHAWGVV